MKTFASRILGTAKDNRDEYIRANLKAGDKISLKLIGDHDRDESAVAAFHGATRIGHVAAESRWVRESLEEGDLLDVTVVDFDHSSAKLASVDVKIGVMEPVLQAAHAVRDNDLAILKHMRDEILVMVMIARSDARMVRAEREIIVRFAEERSKDFKLAFSAADAEALHRWIKRQDPTETQAIALIDKIGSADKDKLRAIYEVSEIVAEMDNQTKVNEEAAVHRVQQHVKAKMV